jgi:hypothetical protein
VDSTNSATPTKLPLFLKDEFPELLLKVEQQVKRLKHLRRMPVEAVHPDFLPFDLIIDHTRHSWIENELALNPLTDEPIDLSNFEEQIDIAVEELGIKFFFCTAPTKKDVLEFREHFKRHEGLSVSMVRKMLERIVDASNLPAFKSSKKEKVDHHHFARIVDDLKKFNRYFKHLFRETFAPLIDEYGQARFDQGIRLRWWPEGETTWKDDFEYRLCHSPKYMPEPFRSILQEDIEVERTKLRRIEESLATLQQAKDNTADIPPSDQDLLI